MSSGTMRETVALGAMALGGVVGVILLVNHRFEERVNQRRIHVSALTAESESTPDANRLKLMKARTTELHEWITQGVMHNDVEHFQRFMELGEEFELRIDRIDPVSTDNEGRGFVQQSQYSIDAVGAYEMVARFVDAIEQEPGFHVVTRLSVSPAEHDENVHVVMTTVHHDFDPDHSPARTALADEEELP